jgi:hypothetical protein
MATASETKHDAPLRSAPVTVGICIFVAIAGFFLWHEHRAQVLGRVQLTRVVVGRSDGTRSVVERTLSAGDTAVVQPSDALQDGSRVVVFAPAP